VAPTGERPYKQLLQALEGGGDIEAAVFIVMSEAADDARQDIRDLLAEMAARNAAKQKLREFIRQVRRDVIANSGCGPRRSKLVFEAGGLGSEAKYHRAELPLPDPEAPGGVTLVGCDLYEGRINTVSQLQAIQDDLKDRLDSLSELGEMESLRLQIAMRPYVQADVDALEHPEEDQRHRGVDHQKHQVGARA